MADLGTRLDVTGRRIVVLAGPGDRRDEDLVAIANAVAGRFDHYICRRDDNLRGRAPRRGAAHPSAALRAAGVPDELDLDHPGRAGGHRRRAAHGRTGDLLLIFADALVRSWKQITKFKTAAQSDSSAQPEHAGRSAPATSAHNRRGETGAIS
jgi:cyanophycin synthetase